MVYATRITIITTDKVRDRLSPAVIEALADFIAISSKGENCILDAFVELGEVREKSTVEE